MPARPVKGCPGQEVSVPSTFLMGRNLRTLLLQGSPNFMFTLNPRM